MAWVWLIVGGLFEVGFTTCLRNVDGFRHIGWTLGFLAAGQLLDTWEPTQVFAAAAVGMTATALVFATIALRHRDEPAPEASAVAA